MSLRSSSRALCAFAVLALCASVRGAEHTFTLETADWKEQPKTVNLAGDFNGWSTDHTPLKLVSAKRWSVTVSDIEEGQHAYKFVIDAGTANQRWINDPKGDKSLETDDGNGGHNSGVIVGIDPVKLPPAKANEINHDALKFSSEDASDFTRDENVARIRVRALAGDVERITPIINGKGFPLHRIGIERGLDVFAGLIPLEANKNTYFYILAEDGTATAVIDQDGVHVGQAAVKAEKNGSSFSVPSVSSVAQVPAWTADANWYQIFVDRFRNGDPSNDPGDFKAYENLIAWNADWFKTQPGEVAGDENFFHGAGNVWKRRYGGDLKGVQEKLPYLRSLGINAIYFNPIFEAESMHKYDTADYRHVDDNFGVRDEATKRRSDGATKGGASSVPSSLRRSVASSLGNNELFNRDGSPLPPDYKETEDPSTWRWTKSDLLFLDFLKDAHAQGFHVIIDGVFNHVGRAHPYFQDVLANGKRSKYADWFDITDWGDEKNWKPLDDPYSVHGKPGGIQWKAWDGPNGHLPNWKKDAARGLAKGPYEHVLAIAKRWGDPDGDPNTRDGIDGWRLDAANEVPHPFWVDFRTAVRAANPDSYITGEIWGPAQAWVNDGKQFDAVMNYQFAMAAQAFFVNQKTQLKPTDFNNRLVKLWFMYPQASALAMQNLFDSHDTDRLASMFVNPDRNYDAANRPQDNAKDHPYDMRAPNDVEWKRLLQAVAFQQCFIGAPMTYYGDEAGMWGADDPSDRQPLPWDDKGPYAPGVGFNAKIFAGFQRYLAIRNALPALREGTFYPVKIDDAANVYAFARELGDQVVYVVINRSSTDRDITLKDVHGTLIDYADPSQVDVTESKDARPMPVVKANHAKALTTKDGSLNVHVDAYGTAILVSQ